MNRTGSKKAGCAAARWGVLALFAVAMGFLEAIVVVYLREIYYPGGFRFPLAFLSPELYRAELVRELATLVMLATVAWLTGKNLLQRLGAFLFAFAVWDILYYAALKLFLGWPESLLTWDILFLIPVTWVGPVLAPVINSLTMILITLTWLRLEKHHAPLSLRPAGWILTFSGAFLIFFTYVRDFSLMILHSGILKRGGDSGATDRLHQAVTTYVPGEFLWTLFIAGELLILAALALTWLRSVREEKNTHTKKQFPDDTDSFNVPVINGSTP